MYSMKSLFYFIFLAINIPAMAQTNTQNPMEKLSWIIDRWISSEGDTKSYEYWEKTSDDLLIGASETVKDGDTIFSEKLRIEKSSEDIFYIADVKHNPAPVKFKLTSINDTEAVFENPEHDFPQKITYRQEEGNLHSSIEGPGKEGKWKKIDFLMSRMR